MIKDIITLGFVALCIGISIYLILKDWTKVRKREHGGN